MYSSIRDIDASEWLAAGGAGLLMDPAFLAVAEQSLAKDLRIWHVVFRNGSRPVACASLCLYCADLAVLATPTIRTVLNGVRAAIPEFARMNMLFCGLPISIGQKSIGFATDCDTSRIIEMLDGLMCSFAQEHGASVLVMKEFTDAECRTVDRLLGCGYIRASTPNLYVMKRQHASFDDYCVALRSHYRYDVTRSLKKFARSGLVAERVCGGKLVAEAYTDKLHSLYEAVVARAEHRLEILPRSFFQTLALAFGNEVSLTLVKNAELVVAFNYAVRFEGRYYFLFCGIDYAANEAADVYFNLFYRELDNWLRDGLLHVHMGQASDEFKTRLGGNAVPLFCYVKGTGVARVLIRAGAQWLFPPVKPWRPHNIFRNAGSYSCAHPAARGEGD